MRKPDIGLGLTALAERARLEIARSQPRPAIAQPPAVTLDVEALPDRFEVRPQRGVLGARVDGWRDSLRAGFEHGFGRPALPTGTLQLQHTDLELVPTARTPTGRPLEARAQITYRARFVDARGRVRRSLEGTVAASRAFADRDEVAASVADAIATLYERLSRDLQ